MDVKSASKLTVTTPSDREVALIRTFDAPRKLVFEALTRPELIRRWLLGPPGWTMPVCEYDPKPGGKYRFVWRSEKDGSQMAMGGVIREVKPPERIVQTEKFDEPWYPGEAIVTTTLVEKGGSTTLTTTVLYESKEARDGVLKSGMEKGVEASYDRLAGIVESKGGRRS